MERPNASFPETDREIEGKEKERVRNTAAKGAEDREGGVESGGRGRKKSEGATEMEEKRDGERGTERKRHNGSERGIKSW